MEMDDHSGQGTMRGTRAKGRGYLVYVPQVKSESDLEDLADRWLKSVRPSRGCTR